MKMPLRVLSIGAALSFGLLGCVCAPVLAKPTVGHVRTQSIISFEQLFKSGVAKGKRHEYKNALADFTLALAIFPNRADALYERSDAYLNLGKLPEAKADIEHAIASDPNWAEAYSYYGRVLDEMGHLSDEKLELATIKSPNLNFSMPGTDNGTSLHQGKDHSFCG